MAAHNADPRQGLRVGDIALGVLPFYHAAGLVVNLHYFFFIGLSIVVVEKYDFPSMLNTIARFQITTLILVPPQAVSFCKHPAVRASLLGSVKYVIVGAAPVPRGLQRSLYEVFPDAQIGQAYGTTEATCTIAMLCSTRKHPVGSVGSLLPGIEAKVCKADGSLAGEGETGELYVKSLSTALGYLNDDGAQETFKDGGWVRTGDQVSMTNNGEIFVHDRLKDFIKVRGFGVAPAELEDCLLQHPHVVDACVIGVPDEYSAPLRFAVVPEAKQITQAVRCVLVPKGLGKILIALC
ncbi:phenylacetyl- ligase [Moniliophthora roreri MCA 2997]|uniref:Phenylacetyl-ligase n=1 Tax=Moniliophthora roreri (strain MCA 2997) TaxID=1381753 RepID=V2X9F4_MONRO|nr:phenylacetyl- ligase [Moniliophthora roreri MCA 2997]